jgi:NAD(P)-dependent dehydrogenase (short-subunit alcohol dehydrogenase family)
MNTIDRRRFVCGTVGTLLAARSGVGRAASDTCNREATAEQATQGLDLTGKTAVVTGCNSGIGFEVMRVLALRGAHVIGTTRTREKGVDACAKVKGRATPVVLELSVFSSVADCAKQIALLTPRIDMLILNAGIVLDRLEQVYGLEKQFVVNHLGHFLLTNRVLDLVRVAPQGRVVTVGSGNHRDPPAGGIQFDNLSGEGWFKSGYHHSKLANGLFSLELSRRLAGTKATSNCVTPGPVRTQILRYTNSSTAHQTKSPAQGAATPCYVATHPSLAKVSGEYFKDCTPAPQSDYQKDSAMARRLWEVSEKLTQDHLG